MPGNGWFACRFTGTGAKCRHLADADRQIDGLPDAKTPAGRLPRQSPTRECGEAKPATDLRQIRTSWCPVGMHNPDYRTTARRPTRVSIQGRSRLAVSGCDFDGR
jgi:hypothetical protein